MTQLYLDEQQIDAPYLLKLYGFTEADFDRMAPEMAFCELYDGVIIMPSPVSILHQDITGFLYELLRAYARKTDGSRVLTGPAVMHLASGRKFEPDVMVIKPENFSRIRKKQVEGPADFVIEVLSDSTRQYDLVEKSKAYREGGVPEAWFIDDESKTIFIDRSSESRLSMQSGRIDSNAIPGFWINPSWLFADEFPDPQECLRKILGNE
jgi:Uma2 family endonuclease